MTITLPSEPPPAQVGVSSEPDVVRLALSPRDRFLILATDGVWEFVQPQDAVDIVAEAATVEDACRAVRLGPTLARAPPLRLARAAAPGMCTCTLKMPAGVY